MKEETNFGGHWNRGHIGPAVLEYFKENKKCKTFLDVGCGQGFNVAYAKEVMDYDAYGIEGDPSAFEKPLTNNLYQHDFENNGKFMQAIPKIDLAWCVSVSEHIAEPSVPDFLDVFKNCKWIVFTWCPIGFPGYHHVNCQTASYWIQKFRQIGFSFRREETKKLKKAFTSLVMIKTPFWRDEKLNKKQVQKMYLTKWGLIFKNDTA